MSITTTEDMPVKTSNYKLKYKLLKHCIKEIVLENAALCDRASEMQHQIIIAQEERKFLWKKFLAIPGNNYAEDMLSKSGMMSQSTQPTEQTKKPRKTSIQKNGAPSARPRQARPKLKKKAGENKHTVIENTTLVMG